tara:strand:+ start:57 stop:566 length:510 start_codon:yes stop_codon:yes gene_type:complete
MNVEKFQKMIYDINNNKKLESAREYSLKSLIFDLKKLNKDLEVHIDNQSFPSSSLLEYAEEGDEYSEEYGYCASDKETNSCFASWRGSYCELSMGYSNNNQHITVGKLLEMSEFVNGKYLYGYKGGDFFMDLDTPIHIANYSDCGNLKLIGIDEIDGIAILRTRTILST